MDINSQTNSSETQPVKKPKPWHYILAFLILVLLWVVILELIIKPRFLMVSGVPVVQRLGAYLLPPLVAVVSVFTLRSLYVRRKQRQQEEQQAAARVAEENQAREQEARQAALLEQKQFSLEILSLGVAVEYLRQAEIWEELQQKEGFDPILSVDPEDYPSALDDKERAHHERESEVLEHVLGWLNEEWAIPVFLAGPPLQNPQMQALLESNLVEALAHGEIEGRRLSVVESLHDEAPDGILQKIFDFMDRHTEVPAVLLVAEDGLALRHLLRAEDSPELLYEGPRPVDGTTETVVALLLGRKDRIEPMRAFIQGDSTGEDPLKPYWEKERLSRSAGAFTTSEWVPSAWSKVLVDQFFGLPVLGHLHRPQFMSFQGSEGIVGDGAKANSLQEAWQTALASLGEAGKNQHLLYDFGPVAHGRKLGPLSRAMNNLDPDFDVFDQGVNLYWRMGDTGAAAPILGLALASVASYRGRGISTSVFLRRDDGASLCMIRPPAGDGDQADALEPEPEYAEA